MYIYTWIWMDIPLKSTKIVFFFPTHLQHAQVASPGGWTSYRLQGPHRCPFWEVKDRQPDRLDVDLTVNR